MARETGVPKLKNSSNIQQWYTRLKTYMIAKDTWPAVKFVPKKRDEPLASKEKSDYSALPFDDEDNKDDEFEYHPRNNEALHHILTHCEDGPANKIRGIKSAREAMVTLNKLYGTSSEIENYLAAERLWTTTYASAGNMEKYTEQFTDTWNEIQRRQISLDFLVRALLVNHLGTYYTGFQERKREIGIEKLSFEDLVSQLKQEALISGHNEEDPAIALTTSARTCEKCKKKGHTKEDCWKDIVCGYCKRKGHPEDRCHKKEKKEKNDGKDETTW